MSTGKCLYCYQPLENETTGFHTRCSKKMFGSPTPPVLDYDLDSMKELAREIVIQSVALTGVQPKLSLSIEKKHGDPKNSRFTIVGLWGGFILKPPTEEFPFLPENEDLTMHIAEAFGIESALHSLIRLRSGELAYITKRFDRVNGKKLALEDFCQLTETLTEDKYRGSMERVGKHIAVHSSRPGLDLVRYFELALCSFVTGNADMHLKNFALITSDEKLVSLSPAYDLVSTKIALPSDKEEMALTMNAKKAKIRKKDFDVLGENLRLPEKVLNSCYERLFRRMPDAMRWIDDSFLAEEMKEEYKELISERTRRLKG